MANMEALLGTYYVKRGGFWSVALLCRRLSGDLGLNATLRRCVHFMTFQCTLNVCVFIFSVALCIWVFN